MDQVYPLNAPAPDPDIVDRHLGINNDILAGVAVAMPTRIDDALQANAQALGPVQARMQRSSQALLTANSTALKPVINALQGHVDAALAGNQAALDQLPASAKVAAAAVQTGPSDWAVVFNQVQNQFSAVEGVTSATLAQPWVIVAAGLTSAQAETLVQQRAAANGTQVYRGPIPTVATPTPAPTPAPVTTPVAPAPTTPVNLPPGCLPVTAVSDPSQLKFPPGDGSDPSSPNRSVVVYSAAGSIFTGPSNSVTSATPGVQILQYVDIPTGYVQWGGTGVQISGICPVEMAPITPQPQPPEPPPEPPPPPPEPPPPPPPPQPQWFCVRQQSGDGSYTYSVQQFADIIAVSSSAFQYVSGPFATQSEAQASCQSIQDTITRVITCPTPGTVGLPDWCSVNVCQTIDALTGAVKGPKSFDLFVATGAGTQENPAPLGTWLWDVKNTPVIGEGLQALIVLAFCKIDALVNSAITDAGANTGPFIAVGVIRAIVDWAAKWFGLGLNDANKRLGYWLNYISPTYIPNAYEADALWQQGFIGEEQWQCWVKANNVCPDPHKLIAEAGVWHPTQHEVERLWRIGWLSDDERAKYQHWNKLHSPLAVQTYAQLYEQYPSMSDVIRFMVRDVWDQTVVESAGLDGDFDAKWTADAKRYGNIAGVSDDLARLNWRAHWVLPAASQIFEMVRRLRPNRVDAALAFTHDDAIKLLGVNDFAPGYRERLLAVSYAPLPIRAIRTLYDTHQISTDEVGERYQDQGYSAKDADLFKSQEEVLRRRRVAGQSHGYTPGFIAKALQLNAITELEARHHMAQLGYSAGAVDDMIKVAALTRTMQFALQGERRAMSLALRSVLNGYQVGTLGRDQALSVLIQQGYSVQAGNVALDALDLSSRTKLASTLVARMRQAILKGEVTVAQGEQALIAAGIAPPRAAEYAASWTLQLSPKRKVLSGNQVLKYVRDGILTSDQARQRLVNLGFAADDVQLMLLEVAYQTQQAEIRLKSALDKQRQKAASALLRESQRQQALADKTRKALCKQTPPGLLRRWYVSRQIDDQYVIDSLSCQGYTSDVTERYLREFQSDRQAADDKKAAKAAKATAAAGNGSTGGTSPTPASGGSP